MLAKYDAYNIQALRRLLAANVQLRFWSNDIMKALQPAAAEATQDFSPNDAPIAKVQHHSKAFRDDLVRQLALLALPKE